MGLGNMMSVITGSGLPHKSVFPGHMGSIRCVAFSRDGRYGATASGDHTAIVWDLKTGKKVVTLGSLPNNLTGGGAGKGHLHIVAGVDFSPDAEYVCTASNDKSMRIWRVSNGEPLAKLEGHMQFLNCCQWAPNSQGILTGSSDKTLRAWRLLRDGNPNMSNFQWGGGTILEFAFAHCNASMQDDHQDSESYKRLTAKSRKHLPEMKCVLTTLLGHQGSVTACSFSPDMKWIVSTSTDKTARIWDASMAFDPTTAERAHVMTLEGHSRAVISCAFSPNSDLVATGSQDSTVRISHVGDWSILREIVVGECYCTAVGFAGAEGEWMLVSTGGKKIKIYSPFDTSICGSLPSAGRNVSTFALTCVSNARQDLFIGGGDHAGCHVSDILPMVEKAVSSMRSPLAAKISNALGAGRESYYMTVGAPEASSGVERPGAVQPDGRFTVGVMAETVLGKTLPRISVDTARSSASSSLSLPLLGRDQQQEVTSSGSRSHQSSMQSHMMSPKMDVVVDLSQWLPVEAGTLPVAPGTDAADPSLIESPPNQLPTRMMCVVPFDEAQQQRELSRVLA